ncbi:MULTISPECIES: flagella biosynthesis chaperone FlgN [Kluyvera]|uniref:flagella biosynthesis chaperone FlgN n=1 Tax=Kluyvera sp. CHPC 1.2972 TaxID=2995176 RepID=UPI002FD7B605
MSGLSAILDQMTSILNSLKAVMDAEQLQLSAGSVNGLQLASITEEKSSLLATLDYLEKQRRVEQDAQREIREEYSDRWQVITETTQQLHRLNQHNGWLLEGQILRNQQAIDVLKPFQETGLYGKDGQAAGAPVVRSAKKYSV